MPYEFTHRLPHEPLRKPSRNEDQYFRLEEFAARKAKARKKARERAEEEARRLRERHQGHCPNCGEMLERFRSGKIQADQCPACQGVWIDREHFVRLTERCKGSGAKLFREVFVQHSLGAIEELRKEEEDLR